MTQKSRTPDPRLTALLAETKQNNPDMTFVLSGPTIYWRCDDGFDYGIFALAIRGRRPEDPEDAPNTEVVKVWDGHTSCLWREWPGFAQIAAMRWEDDGGPCREPPGLAKWIFSYVIYFNPSDYPGKFVTRRHWTNGTEDIADRRCVVSETIQEARKAVPSGLVNMGRAYERDMAIYEVWL